MTMLMAAWLNTPCVYIILKPAKTNSPAAEHKRKEAAKTDNYLDQAQTGSRCHAKYLQVPTMPKSKFRSIK